MSLYNIDVKTIDGEIVSMQKYVGKVLLIVNVASKCGYTNQYAGLQILQEKYEDKGFEVLGFPCNQFLAQEPGTEEEIKNFCLANFKTTFDMFAKIDVNGDGAHPLYKFLKSEASGILNSEAIKWNFTKFLISKDGKVLKRYAPSTEPKSIEKDIEELLK
ncbi:MAG: glutathione peroxidase [Sulfurimonadaceae bacterium]|nr:glutathione peroxidase [Sulfurimonadaceae bacterium]